MIAWLVGVAWGAVIAALLLHRIGRGPSASRARHLRERRDRDRPRRRVLRLVARRLAPAFGPITRVVHGTIARRRSARSTRHLAGDLPLAVDLLAVAVGSGATPFGALEQVVGWVPERVGIAVRRVLAEHRLGVPFGDALDALASSTPSYAPLVDALLAGERLGAPVAPALARVADRLRIEHRRATEARARTVPVKLLFPLVFLVLPAFGLLTVAPALLHAMERL